MALRFTADAADGPFEMGMRALRDPSGFWRGAGIAVALLTLAGLLTLVAALRALPPLAIAAVIASYFCLDSSWTSGFLFLTNDSFALPTGVALLLLARQIFAADEPEGEALPGFKRYLVIERRTRGSLRERAPSGAGAQTRP